MNHSVDLENQLKSALRRREAPPDFADRVLAQVAELPARITPWTRFLAMFRLPSVRFAMAGALACLLVMAGLTVFRQRQERLRAEGELARAQVMFAFQIASSKLNRAKQKIAAVSERPDSGDGHVGAGIGPENTSGRATGTR
ncbi:MAG: hypothetical protein ACKV2V_27390 [Blastocatellia bacterium]